MATVSSEKINIRGVGIFQKKVDYSSKTKLFTIKIPEVVGDDMALPKDKHQVQAESEGEANSKFQALIREWEQTAAATTDIIAFEAEFMGGNYNQEYLDKNNDGKYMPGYKRNGYENGAYMFRFLGKDGRMDDSSAGMTIKWAVYEKKELKQNKQYKFKRGRYFDFHDTRSFGTHIVEIPWSQEREDFFMNLDQQFMAMIEKVYNALGELTPEKLINLTDSGQKLLG